MAEDQHKVCRGRPPGGGKGERPRRAPLHHQHSEIDDFHSQIAVADRVRHVVYPGTKAAGQLYEDEGESYDYEHGAYSLTQFSWTGRGLKVDKKKTGYKSAAKNYRVLLLGKES